MRSHFPAFPHLYDPSGDVVRLLRDVDPAADLLYFGWGTWYLVRYKPNREHVASAIRALSGHVDKSGTRTYGTIGLLELWYDSPRFKANPAAFRHLYQRYLYWTAVRLGARPVAEYRRAFIRTQGFAGIVADFRQAEWHVRHLSDSAVITALNAEKDAAVEASRNELRDERSAVIMANHLAKNPHSVTAAAPDLGRSGFTRTSLTRTA